MMKRQDLLTKVKKLWDDNVPMAEVGVFVGDLLAELERADKENDALAEENLRLCVRAGDIEDIPSVREACRKLSDNTPKGMGAVMLKRLLAYDKALHQIAAMGAVCPEFDRCRHKTCADSAGAALTAINVLHEQMPP